MIKVYNNHSNIIVEMAPHPFFDSSYVVVSHFSFPCSLLQGSPYQSPSYPLQKKATVFSFLVHEVCIQILEVRLQITVRGLFETISTAVSSLSCSQSPSEANIKKRSCGLICRTNMEGSAVITGLFNGTGNPMWWKRGSLLNSGFFK